MITDIKAYAEYNRIPIMRDQTIDYLIKFISSIQPKKILEIGTAIGYSGIIMLKNTYNSSLTTIELNEDRAEIARDNFIENKLDDRVEIIIGDCNEIIPMIETKYDFVLLDGPKGHYYELLPYLKNIINVNGGIFADNIMYMGLIKGNRVVPRKHRTIINSIRNFINDITSDNRFETELIDIEDGMIKAIKRY